MNEIRTRGAAPVHQQIHAGDADYAEDGEHHFAAGYRRAAAFINTHRETLLTGAPQPPHDDPGIRTQDDQ